MIKQAKEWLIKNIGDLAKIIGSYLGLIPAGILLFIFLELFLFLLTHSAHREIFVIQFPITLWVLTKKGGK